MKKIEHNGSTTGFYVTNSDGDYTNFAQPNGGILHRIVDGLFGGLIGIVTRFKK